MTTANVMNPGMSNVNTGNAAGNTKVNQNAVSGNASKVFQGYMKQYDKTYANAETAAAADDKAGSGNSVTDYAKTQYKRNRIQQNSQSTMEDKVNSSKDLIESTEKEIVQKVAEELGIDESEVEEVMEILGFSALQLLQPENLVQLVSQLTGATDSTELLVSVNFQNLMQNMSVIGDEFFKAMDVQPNQLDEIVAQMEILEEPLAASSEEMAADSADSSGVAVPSQMNAQSAEEDVKTQIEVVREKPAEAAERPTGKTEESAGAAEESAGAAEEPAGAAEEPAGKIQNASKMQGDEPADEESNPQKQGEHQPGNMDEQMNVNENHVFANNMNSNMGQADAVSQPTVTPMYSQSVNQLEIIQQIAEQVKVTIGAEETSMEMQLNPENLGKVYLEISSKQGNVNAQIIAQNEAVRDAIQAQAATLQDRLNQAGVKVDAIEVTVASHEFERNLEQDQKGREQSESQTEQTHSGRRNLHLDSLDDLEGLMSEEELVAAQILKDNGNTVDLTA